MSESWSFPFDGKDYAEEVFTFQPLKPSDRGFFCASLSDSSGTLR